MVITNNELQRESWFVFILRLLLASFEKQLSLLSFCKIQFIISSSYSDGGFA